MLYVFIAALVIGFIVLIVVVSNNAINNSASSLGQTREEYLEDFKKPIQERRGKQGELFVKKQLEEILSENDFLFHPLLVLYNQYGDTSEMDFVLVSPKGIFCIEVKYLVGTVRGDEYSDTWEQIYDDDYTPNKNIKNGFKQNENHVSLLERKLNNKYDVENVVIIANDDNDLSDLNSSHVFKTDSFIRLFKELPDKLEMDDVLVIKGELERFIPTEEQLEAHKQRIQRKYHNKA